MSEPIPEVQPSAVVKVARDLREIEKMALSLPGEAVNCSNSQLMPGGRAMVVLGPISNLEAWENLNEATERWGKAYTSAEDEDPDEAWSAFQLLKFWSEDWRRQHDADYGQRPTIVSEAAFLRWLLPWAWENLIEWDDFAKDVNRARRRLEDLVHDGSRAERSHIMCPHCDQHPRLVRKYALLEDQMPAEEDVRWWHLVDHYRCPNADCRHRFDDAEFKRTHAQQLKSEGAERYVPITDAVHTLKAQGRPERTIRKWLAPSLKKVDRCPECNGEWKVKREARLCPKGCGVLLVEGTALKDPEAVVLGYCERDTRRTHLWWPDLWTKHLLTPRRNRDTAA